MRKPRKILLPFSWIYGLVTTLRNWLYDRGFLYSKAYDLSIIGVGNLSVGGTGKTPMVEYLIRLLQDRYKVATLSRGYGRTTKGFILAYRDDTAASIGDEPLQMFWKFPKVKVAVCENRVEGVDKLLARYPNLQVLILDDAFQHRRIKTGLTILLTPYHALYVDDLLLPAGDLRESVRGAKRAQIVVVTKCPEELSRSAQAIIKDKLNLKEGQRLFFSKIVYSDKVRSLEESYPISFLMEKEWLLITGIANSTPLTNFLEERGVRFQHLQYKDHHSYSARDISDILKKAEDGHMLTTEKDFVRLTGLLPKDRLYYLPIEQRFIEGKDVVDATVMDFIKKAGN